MRPFSNLGLVKLCPYSGKKKCFAIDKKIHYYHSEEHPWGGLQKDIPGTSRNPEICLKGHRTVNSDRLNKAAWARGIRNVYTLHTCVLCPENIMKVKIHQISDLHFYLYNLPHFQKSTLWLRNNC